MNNDHIDFAFVLLPSPEQTQQLLALRDSLIKKIQILNSNTSYHIPVTLPHLSIGHYAIQPDEVSALKDLLSHIALQYAFIKEEMESHLHVSDYNISLETLNTRAQTNPKIIDLYKTLRSEYFRKIKTKQPTRRACVHFDKFKNQPEELELLELYYQNWNLPEGGRMRPHFTLLYNHSGKEAVSNCLVDIPVPQSLRNVDLTHLGIVSIDLMGNTLPNGLIHVIPFGDSKLRLD